MTPLKDKNNNKTQVWKYYEAGRIYNNALTPNQYNLVNTNLEFYSGNQWLHINDTPAMSRLSRPTFNIIKRVCQLFVASLTSSNTAISFEPLSYYDGENLNDPQTNAAVMATAEVQNLLEKFKFEYRLRDALFDGAVTGDYCAHFFWNADAMPYGGAFGSYKGEIEMELVDGINVMFGNPNITDVQKQPYILIIGRDTVEHLKWEADRYRKNNNKRGGKALDELNINNIHADAERQWQSGVGGKTEIIPEDDKTGKALYAYMYTKVSKEETVLDDEGNPVMENILDSNGDPIPETMPDGRTILNSNGEPRYKQRVVKRIVTSVHVTKATKNVYIFEDVDTGLTRYPIAWGNWEKQKNQYHGRALVTGIVPNQIFINSMMAMIFRHLQLQSFPKTIYNAELIANWDNEIGVALGVRNLQPSQSLRDVATTLQPADMSNQIVMCIDKVMQYTKDCLGATDAQMGNVRPDNTSALMVLQSSAEVPLENTRAGMHEWVEDIGAILLDMMGTYYGKRPIVRDRSFEEISLDGKDPMLDQLSGKMLTQKTTRRVVQEYDFSQFKHLWFNINVNVGATTYYSEIAMVQTLDNLRRDGTLEIIDYLERIPDKLIPRKGELIQAIKDRAASQNEMAGAMLGGETPQTAPSNGAPAMGGLIDPDKAIANLPDRIQSKYNSLPTEAKNALTQSGAL